jgi:hypothetical protein
LDSSSQQSQLRCWLWLAQYFWVCSAISCRHSLCSWYSRKSKWLENFGFSKHVRGYVVLYDQPDFFHPRLCFFGNPRRISVRFFDTVAGLELYTYVENRSIDELDRKFNLGLGQARLPALFGVLVLAIAYCYELYRHIARLFLFHTFPFTVFVFAAPFLIVSCLLLIERLGPTIKS